MTGDIFLLERDGATPMRAERLAFGETAGRNEAWLRDSLFAHPDLIPLRDLDPTYGPLIPLCTELCIDASRRLDIAFISQFGRLTLVECKLWRNPEARREVIAQVLDYAHAISRWSYSDLQRQVAAASRRHGNVPYELARERYPELREQQFVDDTARAMRAGRFLLIIAGDGIREDVSGIAELINRNAASAFSFGLMEMALYGFEDGSLAIQPRVIVKTHVIERIIVVARESGQPGVLAVQEESDAEEPSKLGESPKAAALRAWWTPVLNSRFDDPDQEPLTLYYPNNVRTPLPWPTKVWLVGYRAGGDTGVIGVNTAGSGPSYREVMSMLAEQRDAICAELPEGTEIGKSANGDPAFSTQKRLSSFADDDERRRWVASTLNTYVNALRPRLKGLMQQRRAEQP